MLETRRSEPLADSWQRMVERMKAVTDALGKPLDPGIFETVVALNALGITTVMSCEGHLERGVAAPWVDVEPTQIKALRTQITMAQQRANQEHALQGSHPLTQEAKVMSEQVKRRQLELAKAITVYLDRFYQGRSVPYHCRLQLHSWGKVGRMRLESTGADLQAIETDEVRRRHLSLYQHEMDMFTTFLKHLYFAQR